MKLRDFSKRSLPQPKKNYPVFNLNNEKRDNAQTSKIKSLEAELVVLKKEVQGLRPLPTQLSQMGDEHRSLNETINILQRKEEQNTILLQQAENKVVLITQYAEDIKRLKAIEESLTTKKTNMERELINSSQQLRHAKQDYNVFRDDLAQKVEETRGLNLEVETLQTNFSTLENEYSELKNLHTALSKINIEDKKELSMFKTECDYLIIDNNAAREKISMLETVKNKVEQWASTLTKTNTESDSKLAAFEQTVQNSKEVMLNMSNQIDSLIEDKIDLVDLLKQYRLELMKPKYFSVERAMRKAGMPNKGSIVDRQYMGLGVPTLLKFKPQGGSDDN